MIFLNKCKMFSWTRRRNSKKNGYKPIKEDQEEYSPRLCETAQEGLYLYYPYRGMLSYPGMYNPYGLGLYKHRMHMGMYGNDIIW